MANPIDLLFFERQMAQNSRDAQDWPAAANYYAYIIEHEPGNADPWYQRGLCHAMLGDLDAAFTDVTQGLRLDPHHASSGGAHSTRGAYYQFNDELELAVEAYTAAIAAVQSPAHFFERGKCLGRLGEYLRAILDFDWLIEQGFMLSDCFFLRGECHHHLQSWDAALADLDASIALDPTVALVFALRGECRVRRNELELAIADLSECIRLDPSRADVHAMRAQCYGIAGKPDEALADANEALRLDPTLSESYRYRAQLHFDASSWQAALMDLEVLSTLCALTGREHLLAGICCWMLDGPDNSQVHAAEGLTHAEVAVAACLDMPDTAWALFLRAAYFLYKGRIDESIADLDEAIRLRTEQGGDLPALAECYQRRGLAYIQTGDHAKAIEDFDEATRNDPQARTYHFRAFCHKRLEHWRKALEDYADALRLAPDDVLTYCSRGQCYTLQGLPADAIEDLTRAIELDPAMELAYFYRAQALMEIEAWAGALEDLDTMLALPEGTLEPGELSAAHALRATCHEELGHDDEAAADRAAVHRYHPNDEPGDLEAWWLLN